MKKKFGIAVLCLLAAVCFSLFFVACDDGEETEEKTITASLSASEVLVGEEVTLTYSASGGETVSVTYSKDGGAAAAVTGTAFTPTERGTYVFTFSAEGYESVTRTLLAKTAQDALFAGGWGTEEAPYQIATAAQLKNIGELESAILAGTEYSFVLTADIDLSGETATGTGNYGSYYVEVIGGTFDGNGHTIFGSNAIADVFHYTYNDTVFRDLTVEFADGNVTRLAAIGAYTASEDLGGGSYATALESLSLTYDNVDYVGQDGVSYYLGNNNAAPVFEVGDGHITGTAGTLTYEGLLDFWSQFDPYTMNTMLVSGDVMLDMLKMSEFQNPLTGLNFQGTGTLTTPLGAKLLRTTACPAGTLIGLDKNYALEQICGSEVTVEYDKLIDRQLERAAITSISGFAKLFDGASKVLTV